MFTCAMMNNLYKEIQIQKVGKKNWNIPQAELEVSVEESGDILEEKDVVLQVFASASGAQEVMKDVTLSLIDDVKLVLNG